VRAAVGARAAVAVCAAVGAQQVLHAQRPGSACRAHSSRAAHSLRAVVVSPAGAVWCGFAVDAAAVPRVLWCRWTVWVEQSSLLLGCACCRACKCHRPNSTAAYGLWVSALPLAVTAVTWLCATSVPGKQSLQCSRWLPESSDKQVVVLSSQWLYQGLYQWLCLSSQCSSQKALCGGC
jgi:hypothetical protein